MKKIEDYLHLYLGSTMHYTGNGKPFKGTVIDEILTIENFELLRFSTQRKLVLRPLSDMTESEAAIIDDLAKHQLDGVHKPAHTKFVTGIRTNTAEAMRFMLKSGFDIFDLIPAGLAIDKTTVKIES